MHKQKHLNALNSIILEYMAPKALAGFTHHPKDDLISFGLVLLEISGVELPWMDPVTKIEGFMEKMRFVLDEWDRTDFDVRSN